MEDPRGNREIQITRMVPKAEQAARAIAARAGLSHAAADDLVQAALMEVIRGWDRWDPTKSTWPTYAINCAKWGAQREISRHAKRHRRAPAVRFDSADADDFLTDPGAADPAEEAEKAGLVELLEIHLRKFPIDSNYAAAARLYFFKGLNQSETARKLGITPRRVFQIVQHITHAIRKKIHLDD